MSSPTIAPPVRYRRSLAGPVVLIALGVLFLLMTTNVISGRQFFRLFADFWPLLLVLWGVVKLVEHYQAKREDAIAPGIGVGGGMLMFFVVVAGLAASSARHWNFNAMREELEIDGTPLAAVFGEEYNFDDEVVQDLPAGSSLKVVSDRGSIAVNVWDQNKVRVVGHKRLYADSQKAADEKSAKTKPQITSEGTTVLVSANTNAVGESGVRTDLEVFVPRALAVEISTRKGDVNLLGREGDVKVNNQRGDVSIENVTGNTSVRMDRGSLRLGKITGNVQVEGSVDNTEVADVGGTVQMNVNGDFFGSITLSKIAKAVTLRSERTEIDFAKIDGELRMESDDLRASQVLGPVRVVTRSKDIHLDDVTGDVKVENDNGVVELQPSAKLPLGNFEITNKRGSIMLTLPPRANFQLTAKTDHGEVESDFEQLKTIDPEEEGQASTISGTVGNGASKVQLNSEYGNIEVRKVAPPEVASKEL